jgi:hypothetical protein
MDLDELYPSRYLRSTDLNRPTQFTIGSVKRASLNGEPKVVVSFKDSDKEWIANKTNGRLIARMYGKETSNWIGKTITLYSADVEFKGELVPGIRVRTTPGADADLNDILD